MTGEVEKPSGTPGAPDGQGGEAREGEAPAPERKAGEGREVSPIPDPTPEETPELLGERSDYPIAWEDEES